MKMVKSGLTVNIAFCMSIMWTCLDNSLGQTSQGPVSVSSPSQVRGSPSAKNIQVRVRVV